MKNIYAFYHSIEHYAVQIEVQNECKTILQMGEMIRVLYGLSSEIFSTFDTVVYLILWS
jgi:hypothetical protein